MNKKDRETIKNKFAGCCMYCGHELGEKFHVDHIKPIYRGRSRVTEDAANFDPNHGTDTMDNLGPACIPCNLWKKTFTIDQFRAEVEAQPQRLMEKNGGMRLAYRFGLVATFSYPVVFWFERFEDKTKVLP